MAGLRTFSLKSLLKPKVFAVSYSQAVAGGQPASGAPKPPPPTPAKSAEVDDNKSYKVNEYYQYNTFSYYDLEVNMVAKRETQPQPRAQDPLVPEPAPPKK